MYFFTAFFGVGGAGWCDLSMFGQHGVSFISHWSDHPTTRGWLELHVVTLRRRQQWNGSSGASGSELVLQCGTGMWPCVSLPQLVPKYPPPPPALLHLPIDTHTHTQLTPGTLAHSRHKLLADFSHIVTCWFVNYWECNWSTPLISTTHLLHYQCSLLFSTYRTTLWKKGFYLKKPELFGSTESCCFQC